MKREPSGRRFDSDGDVIAAVDHFCGGPRPQLLQRSDPYAINPEIYVHCSAARNIHMSSKMWQPTTENWKLPVWEMSAKNFVANVLSHPGDGKS